METKTREGLDISGKIKINTYRVGMVNLVTPYLNQIRALRHAMQSEPATMRDFYLGRIAECKVKIEAIKSTSFICTAVETHNLVMDSPNYGLDLIIQRLVGNNTYSLNILWIEIGIGSTTPTVNDTALTTPTIRLPVSFQEDFGATDAIVQAYVTDSQLPNGTYGEVGSFVDGTSSLGSGQVFNHALLSPAFSKSSGSDVTIEIDVAISNS